MQPISESIKQGQETRSHTIRLVKMLSLAVLSSGLLILDWSLMNEAIFNGAPASFWAWPVVVTALWMIAVSFFALINPDRITFFTFNAIGLIAFLVVMPRDIYVFFGGVLFFLLNLLFQTRLQEEEKNQLNFSIRRTLGNSQVIVTYALLALLGFMIYSNVRDDFQRDPDAFYERLSENAVKGLPYVSQDRSQYNLNQSLGEFFRKQAQQQYPEFNQVSASQQRELMNQIREEFGRQFGLNADENISLRVAMTQIVTQRMREVLGKYERFFPLVFTLLIIALLRTLIFIFNWAVLFLSWLVYKMLLAVKFVRIEKHTVEVEKLEI
jgi:hypothetical protein